MRSHATIVAIAIAATALVAGSAGAQGKSQGKGHGQAQGQQADKRGHDNDVIIGDRDGNGVRVQGNGNKVPPGLAKKPGQMPPGQYKKRYGTNEGATVLGDILRRRGYTVLRMTPQGESQYVYYRLRDGSERRAIVTSGTERLRFSNVPSSVLSAVLAQLY